MPTSLRYASISKGPSAERVFTSARFATDSSVDVPLRFETSDGEFILGRVLHIMWGGPAAARISFYAFDASGPAGETVKCAIWDYDTDNRKSGELVYVSPIDFHNLSPKEKELFNIYWKS